MGISNYTILTCLLLWVGGSYLYRKIRRWTMSRRIEVELARIGKVLARQYKHASAAHYHNLMLIDMRWKEIGQALLWNFRDQNNSVPPLKKGMKMRPLNQAQALELSKQLRKKLDGYTTQELRNAVLANQELRGHAEDSENEGT